MSVERTDYAPTRFRIGVDVGGTFTDLCLFDEVEHKLQTYKVPSTPDDFCRGISTGIAALLAEAGVPPNAIGYLVQGSTVATNAMIQRTGFVRAPPGGRPSWTSYRERTAPAILRAIEDAYEPKRDPLEPDVMVWFTRPIGPHAYEAFALHNAINLKGSAIGSGLGQGCNRKKTEQKQAEKQTHGYVFPLNVR